MRINTKLSGPLILTASQYLNQLISPLVSILVVRYLGVEQFGLYASALALVTLLLFLPDFGLQQAALNFSARKEWCYQQILRKTLVVSIIYSLLTYLILASCFYFLNYNQMTAYLGYILGLTFFRTALVTITTTALQLRSEYTRIALWSVIIGFSQWITTLLLMFFKVDIFILITVPLIICLVTAIVMGLIEGKRMNIFRREDDNSSLPTKALVNESWKFGLAVTMHQLYYKSDVAILSLSRSPTEVGLYSVSFRIIEMFFLLPSVVFNQVLYPKYCFWIRENRKKLDLYYELMNKIMIILGLLVATFLSLFGREILQVIFGEVHKTAIIILMILTFSMPLRYWLSSAGAILTNDKLIKAKLKFQSYITIVNLVINIILIPKLGATFAAYSMVVTQFIILLGYSFLVNKFLMKSRKKIINSFLVFITLLIIACVFVFLSMNAGTWMKISVMVLISVIDLFALIRWLRRDEAAELFRLAGVKRILRSREVTTN